MKVSIAVVEDRSQLEIYADILQAQTDNVPVENCLVVGQVVRLERNEGEIEGQITISGYVENHPIASTLSAMRPTICSRSKPTASVIRSNARVNRLRKGMGISC